MPKRFDWSFRSAKDRNPPKSAEPKATDFAAREQAIQKRIKRLLGESKPKATTKKVTNLYLDLL